MFNGVMLLWFLLTAAAVLFVTVDIRYTPESSVLKWGFVLLTAYTGPVGAFLYVLGCREPLSGLHERYTASRWRQVLGSTMHCVAGDGVGILAGAVIASFLTLAHLLQTALEYVLGFGFGWTVFQALFMREMSGGSYRRSLASTFIPELLSMNWLMSGMVPIAALGRALLARPVSPLAPDFWFVMSMALLVGFILAYPINWWLVARGLKHGMMTVRPRVTAAVPHRAAEKSELALHRDHDIGHRPPPSPAQIVGMAVFSIVVFALAIGLSLAIRGITW